MEQEERKKWKPKKKSRCQLEFLQAAARTEYKKPQEKKGRVD